MPLHLAHRRRRRVEAEQHVMALAILLDAIGEAAQAPIFALFDRAAIALELGDDLIGEAVHLLLRDFAARDQHAFV